MVERLICPPPCPPRLGPLKPAWNSYPGLSQVKANECSFQWVPKDLPLI